MSASPKEREQFIAQLTRALPDQPAHIVAHRARLLMRHAATHSRLEVEACNERVSKLQDKWDARIEKREAQIERRITEIAAELGLTVDFGGDPRGYTVKLHLPNGAYNTWGGKESGYGVPQ